MRPFRLKQTRNVFAVLVLASVCFLQVLSLGLETLRSFRESPVAAAAITTGPSLETCAHHPDGCPKSCLCPKTHVHPESETGSVDAQAARYGSVLGETSWTTCNDEGSPSVSPVFAVFLTEPAFQVPNLQTTGSLTCSGTPVPRAVPSAPPQKIPIA
jgi:hypothetical protein